MPRFGFIRIITTDSQRRISGKMGLVSGDGEVASQTSWHAGTPNRNVMNDLIRTYDNFSQFRPTRTKSMRNVCNVARTESGFANLASQLSNGTRGERPPSTKARARIWMERGPLSKDACVKNREFEPNAKVVGTLSEYVMSRMGLAGVLFWVLFLG